MNATIGTTRIQQEEAQMLRWLAERHQNFSCATDQRGTLTNHQCRSSGTHFVFPLFLWDPGLCSLIEERQLSLVKKSRQQHVLLSV